MCSVVRRGRLSEADGDGNVRCGDPQRPGAAVPAGGAAVEPCWRADSSSEPGDHGHVRRSSARVPLGPAAPRA